MESKRKNVRSLDMYIRLCEGKTINKKIESASFGVDERSIQRDIDDIRAYLDERNAANGDGRQIIYDRAKNGFIMVGEEPTMMTNSEILAVSKILLESRAFSHQELKSILDKLVNGCVPLTNMQMVSKLISNEKFHYVELGHKEYIQDMLWRIASDIYNQNVVSLRYARGTAPKESIKRVVEPVSILFSEYYFYLNAYIVEKDDLGKYVHKYSYPAIFRIDRIKNYKSLDEKFKIPYANRFEEGEFRKRIQFMYAGKLESVQLKFYGANPEPILDRLPTARITEKYENECTIEAEVYGKGILMWLLSQASKVEILKPKSLRDEMKQVLQDMLKLYD